MQSFWSERVFTGSYGDYNSFSVNQKRPAIILAQDVLLLQGKVSPLCTCHNYSVVSMAC